MSLDQSDHTFTYTCRRRWPGPRGATSIVRVRVGDPRSALAEHDPWPLHRVEVLSDPAGHRVR